MLKIGKTLICAVLACAFLFSCLTAFAAEEKKQAPVKVAYDSLEELVKENGTSYNLLLAQLEITKNAYYSTESSIYSMQNLVDTYGLGIVNSETMSQMGALNKALKDLREGVDDLKKVADDAVILSVFAAQNYYRTYFYAAEQVTLAKETLGTLEAKLANAKLKHERGIASQKDIDDAQKNVEDQQKTVKEAEDKLRDTLNNLKVMLNIPLETQILLSEPPEFELSMIDDMDYDADLEKYMENNYSIKQAQREYDRKKNSSSYTYAEKQQMKLNIEKATNDARTAFEDSYNGLSKGYSDYLKAESDFEKSMNDFDNLKQKLDSGMISVMTYNDVAQAMKAGRLGLDMQKFGLYTQAVMYFHSVDGVAIG